MRINEQLKYKHEIEILKSLFVSSHSFTELRKIIKISKPTLTIKLNNLKKAGFIYKGKGKRTKYYLDFWKFNRSPLYPYVMAALLFRILEYGWIERFLPTLDKIRAKNYKDFEQEKAEISKICDESIEDLEKAIGKFIIQFTVAQTEKDVQAPETINKFINFISIFIKRNEWIKVSVKKSDSYITLKDVLQMPYEDLEKELLKFNAADKSFNQDVNISGFDLNTKSWLLSNQNDFYKELGFPFHIIYEKRKIFP